MKCKYSQICPTYDRQRCEYDEMGNMFNSHSDYEKCVTLLLEAYHQEKGTPYKNISKYLD